MSKRLLITLSILVIAGLFLPNLCNKENHERTSLKIDPAFAQYISAFTSGSISSGSTIKIRFANEVKSIPEFNTALDNNFFDFTPSIKGKAYWIDNKTIEFRPDEKLPSDQFYDANFALSEIMTVPDNLKNFQFQFKSLKQGFDVAVDNIKSYDKSNYGFEKVVGTFFTADAADNEQVEKALTATQNDKLFVIKWTHDGDKKTHTFTIDSVKRGSTASEVVLRWNGEGLGVKEEAEKIIEIPAIGDFKIVNVTVSEENDQAVIIQFSDFLQDKQNLEGLVTIGNLPDLKFTIEDNLLFVYPNIRQTGNYTVSIQPSVKNSLERELGKVFSAPINFEAIKPAVKLVGKGVIMPNSNGLVFPFEAVNLKAVDVKIVKIYETNVLQFLQVNQLDGSRELKRVGKVVMEKVVPLAIAKKTDYGRWNRFYLDMAELINAEPGAIYNVIISFKQKYSTYNCGDSISSDYDVEMQELTTIEDDNSWNYYSDYYYDDYYYDDYNYSERENPCTPSYFNSTRSVNRNILASNLGLIVKAGNSGSMNFVVTDLVTTKPVKGATIELYDFQQQLQTTLITDADGMVPFESKHKPFALVAKQGKQRGYMKLDDGSALSLSNFDISGESIQKGIKGFIYGERGVWRPGDSLFLNFILEDKDKLLPESHPVSFELINPQGQVSKRTVLTSSINGFYNFSTNTEQDAPTGNWMARIKVGGASFTKNIKIETIMPNRLKLALDFGVKKLSVKNKDVSGNFDVKWLHGAIARNLKADVNVTLNTAPTAFEKYKDYVFDDPAKRFNSEAQNLFDGNLDENGHASVSADIADTKEAPGMLRASFVARVFEKGGGFSIDRFTIPYSPYESYVGIRTPQSEKNGGMLYTDTNNIVKVVTLDDNGNPVSREKLKVEIYKIQWRWWWQRSDDDLSEYVGNSYQEPIQTTELSTVNGKGQFSFRINYPEWGRYLVRVTDEVSGHSTGSTMYLDWPGYYSRENRENSAAATMLTFSADKEKYKVGDNVRLTIPSSNVGRALVSIESGSKVLKSYWVETKQGETPFVFPVTEEMAPNVYVNVTLLQPHAQTTNDLPIRLYGVIPILVEDPNTHLRPMIKMPEVLRPEEKASITIREENGKAMAYTIAVVDEGLLDLTRFKTPDPWEAFYAREALGVKTWDMFDYVMGAYGGDLEKILSIGGDGEGKGKDGAKANRFKPMVKFFGPFYLKKGETQTQTFMMPQYIGSVRTMVIAGDHGAYGSAEKTTPVRKPLMVLATLPRVVGPGEEVKLPVTVFAMEKNIKNVTLEITPNNMFTVEGTTKRNITFTEIGDNVVNFDLKVKSGLGIGKVKVVARCGNERAEYNIELDVRNPNTKISKIVEAVIEPGKTWTSDYTPAGINGTNKGTLEFSTIPPINLGERLRYLIDYPHGCVEQTTSSVFPQLFLGDIMVLPNETKQRIEKNIKAAITRLKSFQTASGGLAYWPGESDPSDWGSTYAGHFLLEAEAKGYTLPSGMKESWKKYQKKMAQSWSKNAKSYYYNDDLIQAYRLYTLALAKSPELGAMNRLKELKDLSTASKWRLAAAYELAGQSEVARKLVKNLSTKIASYREMYYSYGSNERDEAMMLETMSLMSDRVKAAVLLKEVCANLSNANNWMSTQTTAYCLIAVAKYAGKDATSNEMNLAYKLNKQTEVNSVTRLSVAQIDMKVKGTVNGNVQVKNKGKGILFARIILQGIPETGQEVEAENNLEMTVTYTTMKGEAIMVDKLEQGTDFIAQVTIHNPGLRREYRSLALTQIFASGWEIHNTRMDDFESAIKSAYPTYQDIRDDRVYTYFDLNAYESKTFRIALNASYLGKFYLPGAYSEAMYDNSISSLKKGKWVEVVSAGEVQ